MRREKLQAAAAAHFDAVEIFENDLLQFSGETGEVRRICADLELTIDLLQLFRDFDDSMAVQVMRSLARAQRKFDIVQELDADLGLFCSNVQPDALSNVVQLVEQFHQLAELAG